MSCDSEALELALKPRQIAKLFPFHAVIDTEMRLVQIGPSLRKVLPQLELHCDLRTVWQLERPLIPFSFEDVWQHSESLFLIRASPQVRLRGQMVHLSSERIAFLCSPWLPEPGSMTLTGLTFEDFPLHDSMPEFVQVVQTHKLGMEDLRRLTTKLQQQKSALREANRELSTKSAELQKLALIASRTDNGVVITDTQGNVEWINEGFTRMSGYTLSELRGRKPGEVLQGAETDPEAVAFMRSHLRQGLGFRTEVQNYQKDGSPYWIAIEVQPMFDDAGQLTGFMGMQRDITTRKNDQAKLHQAMESLRLAVRIAQSADRAKTDFLASVSHEIRTPLNSIVGLSELLRQTNLDSEQLSMANTIWNGSEALLHLINDLLDVSKIEAGEIEILDQEFDPGQVCMRAIDIVRRRAEQKKLTLTCECPANTPPVVGDASRVGQILVNLLSNAIKFTESGSIVLQLRWEETEPSRVALEIAVTDTGIGIPNEARDQIFQRFYRVDSPISRRAGGTGLGLSISKSLAIAMGGSLRYEPAERGGSRFVLSVVLPLADSTDIGPVPSRVLSAATDVVTGRDQAGVRILLVEDYADSADYAQRVLSRAGFEVTLADSVSRAVELAKNHRFDLIFMDLLLPDGSGLDAAASIREHEKANGLARVPMIALTAHALRNFRVEAERAQIDDYLTKPIRPDALVAAVRYWTTASYSPQKHAHETSSDSSDLDDLRPGFLARAAAKTERILRQAEAGDLSEAVRVGHNLKGSGTTYGFEEISRLGHEIERAARSGDKDATCQFAEQLKRYLAEVTR